MHIKLTFLKKIKKDFSYLDLALISFSLLSIFYIKKVSAMTTYQNSPLDSSGYEQCNATCTCGYSSCTSCSGSYHDNRCGGGSRNGFAIGGSPAYTTGTCGSYSYWDCCSVSCGGGGDPTDCSDPTDAPTITSFTLNPTNNTYTGSWNTNHWSSCAYSTDIMVYVVDVTAGTFVSYVDLSSAYTSYTGTTSPGLICGTHQYTFTVVKIWRANGTEYNVRRTTSPLAPACPCTNTAPAAPTSLKVNGVAGGTVTNISNVTFSWDNGTNWGTRCVGNVNQNLVRIWPSSPLAYLVDYRPGTVFASYVHTPSKPFTHYKATSSSAYVAATSAVNDLGDTIKCNGTYTWQAYKGNGYGWAAATSTFNVTAFSGPVVNSVTLPGTTIPAGVASNFTVNASDVDGNLAWVKLYVENASGALIYTSPSQACSGASCSKVFSWTPPDAGDYRVYGVAADTCGVASAVGTKYTITATPVYKLNVVVKQTDLAVPDGSGNLDFGALCNETTYLGPLEGAAVTYVSSNIPTQTETAASDASGNVPFQNIPAEYGPLTLSASYSENGSCESYEFYCIDGAEQSTNNPVSFTDSSGNPLPSGSEKTVVLGVGQDKKDSWETIIDGDLYAKNVHTTVSCAEPAVGGGFVPTTLAKKDLGGFLRAAGVLTYDDIGNVFNEDGGFARNLDNLETTPGNPLNSYDMWLHTLEFPDTSSLPSVSVLSNISSAGVYKTDGNLNISGNYNLGSSDALAVVYVDGALTISGNVTSSNGFIVFVAKEGVIVSSSVGVADYTTLGNFNPSAPASVVAGIISLEDTTFSPSGSTDIPVIIDGFILSRGTINFNKDLLENNAMYPAHVVRFFDKVIPMLSNLENSEKTGLSTYDVQWVYDEN